MAAVTPPQKRWSFLKTCDNWGSHLLILIPLIRGIMWWVCSRLRTKTKQNISIFSIFQQILDQHGMSVLKNCMCSLSCSLWAHSHILEVNAFTHIHVLENGPNGEQALKLCVMQTGGTGPETADKHITHCFVLLQR